MHASKVSSRRKHAGGGIYLIIDAGESLVSQLRRVSGTVVRLCCQSCHGTFPHFRFEGEGDADTAGLGSLSSCMKNEVVIAEMSASEWNNFESSGAQKFQDRLSSQLGRSDLRAVQLLRVHHSQSSPVSVTFKSSESNLCLPSSLIRAHAARMARAARYLSLPWRSTCDPVGT